MSTVTNGLETCPPMHEAGLSKDRTGCRCIEAVAALLPDQQLQGLLLLSVFPGQFDVGAAAAVLDVSLPAAVGLLQVPAEMTPWSKSPHSCFICFGLFRKSNLEPLVC
jgi:hypothetical protein